MDVFEDADPYSNVYTKLYHSSAFTGKEESAYANDDPEFSLGLLLADITSMILLSTSTDRFLRKRESVSGCKYGPGPQDRDTSHLLEAAGSTIDVLYELLHRQTSLKYCNKVISSNSDSEQTLTSGVVPANEPETSWRARDLEANTTQHSGEYLSCESENSEVFMSCEALTSSPRVYENGIYQNAERFQNGETNSLQTVVSDPSIYLNSHNFNTYGANITTADHRSLLTVDSGISSPYQSLREPHQDNVAFNQKLSSEDNSRSYQSFPEQLVEDDVVKRVKKLKLTVDKRLRDSLSSLNNFYQEEDEISPLKKHIHQMKEKYIEKKIHDDWGADSMYEVIMDKALTSSVLAMENAQLGKEIVLLRKELEDALEDAKWHQQDKFRKLGSPMSRDRGLPSTLSEDSDSSSTDTSSPDTQLLRGISQRTQTIEEGYLTPSCTAYSGGSVFSQTGRRKLEVPPNLRGTKYLSITNSCSTTYSYESVDDIRSGCCYGLFSCFPGRKGREKRWSERHC